MLYQLIVMLALLMAAAPAHAINLPQLPQAYVDTTMPSTTVTKTVCASGCNYTNAQLQQAIDAAVPGTTITLQAGATYQAPSGNGFILRNKTAGTGWIIIQSSAMTNLPAAGTRVGPSNSPNMPKLLRNSAGNYALTCEASAHHYRLVGIELMNPGNLDSNAYGGAFVNCDGMEPTLAAQTHHIILDRVYIHGPSAPHSVGVRFGVVFGGQHQAVIDSHIDWINNGDESKAIVSWDGAGPFKIVNNHLSAAGENIMFGGARTYIANLTPSDIEIRNNYLYKPLAWRDDPNYSTDPNKVAVKNHLEFKHAQRILVDGNLFENVWASAQGGTSFVVTPRSECTMSWAVVQDVTITNNWFKNVNHAFAFSGQDRNQPSGCFATKLGGRILVKNNLITGLGAGGNTGAGWGWALNFANQVSDVTVDHNTFAGYTSNAQASGRFLQWVGQAGDVFMGFTIENTLASAAAYPYIFMDMGFPGGTYLGTMPIIVPSYAWTKTVIAGPWPSKGGFPTSYMPSGGGNEYPSSETTLGFANPGAGDYGLSASSPYKSKASDGSDIGVNMTLLAAAIKAGASSPSVTSSTPSTPTSPSTSPVPIPTGPLPAPVLKVK